MEVELYLGEVRYGDRRSNSRQVEGESSRARADLQHPVSGFYESFHKLTMHVVSGATTRGGFESLPLGFAQCVVKGAHLEAIFECHALPYLGHGWLGLTPTEG